MPSCESKCKYEFKCITAPFSILVLYYFGLDMALGVLHVHACSECVVSTCAGTSGTISAMTLITVSIS